MKTYTIDPVKRAGLVRSLILRLALTSTAILAVVLAVAIFYLLQIQRSVTETNVIVMGAAVLVLAGVFVFRSTSQVRTYDQGLASIEVSLGIERVDKRQGGLPTVRITRSEVTALIETDNGVLVMTRDKARFLWVPSQLHDYGEARSELERWMPIRKLPAHRPLNVRMLTVAWSIGTALCVGVLLLAKDTWQVLLAGAATMAIYIFVYRLLRAQGNVDMKFRRTYSGILMFLTIVVAIKLMLTVFPMIVPK